MNRYFARFHMNFTNVRGVLGPIPYHGDENEEYDYQAHPWTHAGHDAMVFLLDHDGCTDPSISAKFPGPEQPDIGELTFMAVFANDHISDVFGQAGTLFREAWDATNGQWPGVTIELVDASTKKMSNE